MIKKTAIFIVAIYFMVVSILALSGRMPYDPDNKFSGIYYLLAIYSLILMIISLLVPSNYLNTHARKWEFSTLPLLLLIIIANFSNIQYWIYYGAIDRAIFYKVFYLELISLVIIIFAFVIMRAVKLR